MRMLPLGPYGCLCRQSARLGHRSPACAGLGRKGAHPVNRDREIANQPQPAQTRRIAADEALSTRVDLASADGPHASPARRLANDGLTSIADARSIFQLGRTAACELTRQPGFPDPVLVSARCYRWPSGVGACAVGRHSDRDEPMASTAVYSGLRRGELAAPADSGWRTPSPRDPPLMGEVLRARPSRPAEYTADFITSRERLPRDGSGVRRPVPRRRRRIRTSARHTSRAAAWNGRRRDRAQLPRSAPHPGQRPRPRPRHAPHRPVQLERPPVRQAPTTHATLAGRTATVRGRSRQYRGEPFWHGWPAGIARVPKRPASFNADCQNAALPIMPGIPPVLRQSHVMTMNLLRGPLWSATVPRTRSARIPGSSPDRPAGPANMATGIHAPTVAKKDKARR